MPFIGLYVHVGVTSVTILNRYWLTIWLPGSNQFIDIPHCLNQFKMSVKVKFTEIKVMRRLVTQYGFGQRSTARHVGLSMIMRLRCLFRLWTSCLRTRVSVTKQSNLVAAQLEKWTVDRWCTGPCPGPWDSFNCRWLKGLEKGNERLP